MQTLNAPLDSGFALSARPGMTADGSRYFAEATRVRFIAWCACDAAGFAAATLASFGLAGRVPAFAASTIGRAAGAAALVAAVVAADAAGRAAGTAAGRSASVADESAEIVAAA